MQPVRKKKQIHERRRLTLISALVALLAVGAVLFFVLRQNTHETQNTVGEKPDLTLLDHDEETIERITVHPSRTDSYTLVRTSDGIILEGQPEYPLRDEFVRVLFYYAGHLNADDFVTEADSARLEDYGLQPGVCGVRVTLLSGEEYHITLGNTVPMDEIRYYACVSGKPGIYTVTTDVMDALNLQFNMLHPVPKLSVSADLIDCVTCSEGWDEPYFSAERTDTGWSLTAPFRYPLSTEKMEKLLFGLENLRFSTWVGKDTALNRHRYGFEAPGMILSLDFAPSVLTVPDEDGNEHTYDLPASNITIRKGGKYSDTASYYLFNGEIVTGTVVTFSAVSKLNWQECVTATPFLFGQNNLSEAVVVANGTETKYEIRYVERVLPNNQFETNEYGNTVYEMRVRKNGQPFDAYAFSEYYAKLAALSEAVPLYQTELPEYLWVPGNKDVPLVTVRVKTENGKAEMTVSLYPGPVGRDYLAVDGVCVFTVPRSWAAAVQDCP